MGKGGTKFVGEAVGTRNKGTSYVSGKEMRQQMQKYLETGVHPEVDFAEREKNLRRPPPPLPDFDPNRSFVFMDMEIGSKPAGRIVIELFDDLVPAAANSFRARCLPGSAGGLRGTKVHKLLQTYGCFFGKRQETVNFPLQTAVTLRHVELGIVSMSLSGDECVISLGRALVLDAGHQVVGRVHMGKEIVESFNSLSTLPNDAPWEDVVIRNCGATNPQGTHESLTADQGETTVATLKQETKQARTAVMAALEVGLSTKRKADELKSASDLPSASGTAKPAQEANKKRMFDAVLGHDSDDTSDSSDDSKS